MTEEQKQRKRDYQRRYSKTPRGKAAAKKYWASEKGIAKIADPNRSYEARISYFKKYQKTPTRTFSLKVYNQSELRKLATERYNDTEKGKLSNYTKSRRYVLKKYGLTIEAADEMFNRQGRKCANPGCPATEPGGHGTWHVDHDHLTDRVRGLLCSSCNMGLGLLKDSEDRILGLVEYLKQSREVEF